MLDVKQVVPMSASGSRRTPALRPSAKQLKPARDSAHEQGSAGDWTSVDRKLRSLMSTLQKQGVGVINKENSTMSAPAPAKKCQCEALRRELSSTRSALQEQERKLEGAMSMSSILSEVGEGKEALERALDQVQILNRKKYAPTLRTAS